MSEGWKENTVAVVLAGLVGLALAPAAVAGSVVSELEYKYPCEVPSGRGVIKIDYSGFSGASVALEFRFDEPVLSINEQLTFEQPFEVVVFEYFAACQLAKRVDQSLFNEASANPRLARDLLRDADCAAISELDREGLVRSYEAHANILEYFQYRKGEQGVLNIPFWQRADNIAQSCQP